MKRKLSVAFCAVCAFMILIPLALTDFRGGGVSEYEKRQLATFPQVIAEDGVHIRELGKMDDWINDNIGLRSFFQNIYTNLFVNVLGISSSDKVYFGSDDWYFYTLDSNMEIGTGRYLLNQEQLAEIAKKQQKISDYYAAQGIEYLLVLTPSKVSVYTEHVAEGLTVGYTMADQLTEYLEQNTTVRVVNTKPSVVAAKDQGQLFWRTDTHWTQLGSYAAYSGIIDYMNASAMADTAPATADFSASATGYGEFNAMLGNYRILGEETVPSANMTGIVRQITSGAQYDALAAVQLRLEPNYPAVIIENENADSGELLILGDSQWEIVRNMPLYFSHNFSKVISLRSDAADAEIDANTSPDVFLFACSERYIPTKLTRDVPGFIGDIAEPVNGNKESIPNQLSDTPLALFVDTCNDENQTEEQTVQITPGAASYRLYGWAGDTERGEPLSALYVKAGDQVFRCDYGIDRQSVVDYFKNENLRYTGFSVTLPESVFEEDTVEQLQFIGVSQDGAYRYADHPYAVSYVTENPAVDMDGIPGQLSDTPLTLFVDTCNDENQTEEQTVQITPGAASYRLYGWAGDTERGEPLSALYVKAGDQVYRCDYGIDRQSVVDYFQNENLRYTGFSVTLPGFVFEGGAVEQLQFIGVSQDGAYRYADHPYAVSYVAENPEEEVPPPVDEQIQEDSQLPLILLLGTIALLIAVIVFLWKKSSFGVKLEQHSFLFEELVKRDFTLKYKRTVLGAFWSLLSPLINLLIMWLVFNKMLGSNIDHFVIYLFAGQLVFSYFSDATNLGMTSLLDNAAIFTKVNVPKYLFLFSRNVSSLINFGITLLVFFLFVVLEGIPFTWKFLMLIYPILCLIAINLGVGMILSALYIFFRDMQYLWGLALQLIMWMSAIFYSIDGYAENVQKLFLLNPVYLCIRYFRKIVIENTVPALQFHLLLAAMAVAFVSIGCWMYKRYNTKFLYYV